MTQQPRMRLAYHIITGLQDRTRGSLTLWTLMLSLGSCPLWTWHKTKVLVLPLS